MSKIDKSISLIVKKLNHLKEQLTAYFKERDAAIEGCLLTIITQQNCVLYGPPGVAKSMLISAMMKGIEAKKFDWLLSKFSQPEELFGPYSIPKLKEGSFERITTGKLPESNVAFLDEMFNGNSSILNSMNQLMNERIFERKHVDLLSVFAATNFEPEDPFLVAYVDRFLFRYLIEEIHDATNFKAMLDQLDFTLKNFEPITLEELEQIHNYLEKIDIKKITPLIVRIREDLKANGIIPSSRRYRASILALKAYALLDNRNEVISDDLLLLKHLLWTNKKDIQLIESLLLQIVSPVLKQMNDLLNEAIEIYQKLKSDSDEKNHEMRIIESTKKLREILDNLKYIYHRQDLSDKMRQKAISIFQKVSELRSTVLKEKIGVTTDDVTID